jgi:hypothetical protein
MIEETETTIAIANAAVLAMINEAKIVHRRSKTRTRHARKIYVRAYVKTTFNWSQTLAADLYRKRSPVDPSEKEEGRNKI